MGIGMRGGLRKERELQLRLRYDISLNFQTEKESNLIILNYSIAFKIFYIHY